MATITVNRGEDIRIPFSISDTTSSLLGLRVTWVIGSALPRVPTRRLEKKSDLGASSTDVTIITQTAQLIDGTINLTSEDFDDLPLEQGPYEASLWIDDGLTISSCVTPGGVDKLVIREVQIPDPLV